MIDSLRTLFYQITINIEKFMLLIVKRSRFVNF